MSSAGTGKHGVSHGERSRDDAKELVLEAIEDALENDETDLAGNVLVPPIAKRVDYCGAHVRDLALDLVKDGKLEKRPGVDPSSKGAPIAYNLPDGGSE